MLDADESSFSHHLDVFAVADYLISLDALRPEPDVTPLKLAKLLYLAQSNYLASTGRRMFDENVEAYEHGPVVHREWKRHSGRQIIAAASADPAHEQAAVPDDVADFLDAVWARYSGFSAQALRQLTHEQAPWRDNYRENAFRPVIPDADMAAYFREHVPVDDRVFHPSVVVIPDDFVSDEEAVQFAERVARYAGP